MSRMQEAFIRNVREMLKATRPHVDYVKDFERRAEKDPKGCAEEALRELMASATILLRDFKTVFGVGFEQAFQEVFSLTPGQQYVIRDNAPLPDNPLEREFFLTWLHWLHFYRITLGIFEQYLKSPGGPHEGHARAMCEAFVKHELASWCVKMMVADNIDRQLPDQAMHEALVESFTAYFVAHISLTTNIRLRKAINRLRGQDEREFERLIREVAVEVLPVWREKRAAWRDKYFHPDDLMEIRTEIARRLEKSTVLPQEQELQELAAFADREKLMKRAKAAGLSPQELEFYALFVTGMKPKDVAGQKGVTPEHARQVKHRINNKLNAAGL